MIKREREKGKGTTELRRERGEEGSLGREGRFEKKARNGRRDALRGGTGKGRRQ